MPDAYSQRGWGTPGGPTSGGPNIQAPIGNLVAARMAGTGWGRAGAGALALQNPLYRRKFGEVSGSSKPNIGPGPLGDLGIAGEQWPQNRQSGDTSFQDLQGLVDTRSRVNSGFGRPGGRPMGQGAGFGMQDDMLRRLLMARMGGGL